MSALPSEIVEFPSEQSHLQEVINKTQQDEEHIRKVSLDLLYRKYRGICWICRHFCPRDKASRDHIIPKSLGGTDDISNLALAHKLCNSKRGNGYNEIHYAHFTSVEDRQVIFLEEHGLMYQVVLREDGGISVILSKKREDWVNGNYRTPRKRA